MSAYRKYAGDLFLPARFYRCAGAVVFFYVCAFYISFLLPVVNFVFAIFCALWVVDYFFMFLMFRPASAERVISDRLSNGEENDVALVLRNNMRFPLRAEVVDELPVQLQERNFVIKKLLRPGELTRLQYFIRPAARGNYQFGDILLYLHSPLGLVKKRQRAAAEHAVKVFPSFARRSSYALDSPAVTNERGNKRVRKIGQSMEFEQITDYVPGDDIRTINWKATARKGSLAVNNYTEERSQQVYCIIDKGRLMKMPFNGLSLLDHAINATLALVNVCLQKQDRAGLMTFSNKPGTTLAADSKPLQRENVMQVLYKERTDFMESDFEMLYLQVRAKIRQRSLLILFTNFESLNGLKRQISYLRAIAKYHLLLVVFFENTELTKLSAAEAQNVEDVYVKTIAEKLAFEKRMVVKELQQYGILCVLTAPENLTVNAVNKYLELKVKRAI